VIDACAAFYGDKLAIFNDEVSGANAASILASEIAEAVTTLGLPSKLRGIGFDKDRLSEVSDLLIENYPHEVNDLGTGAQDKLAGLLESLW
jgi:hypothetical protein